MSHDAVLAAWVDALRGQRERFELRTGPALFVGHSAALEALRAELGRDFDGAFALVLYALGAVYVDADRPSLAARLITIVVRLESVAAFTPPLGLTDDERSARFDEAMAHGRAAKVARALLALAGGRA